MNNKPTKLVRIKKTGDVFPLIWSNEIKEAKRPTFKYFKRGEGYKKTTSFEILDETIPSKWDRISWLEIAKLTSKYGLEVGEYLGDGKTAGIIARQTAAGYAKLYNQIKDVIPENFDGNFFENMKCNYMLSCFGIFTLDIIRFDKWLSKDPDYMGGEATYKGKPCSMKEYIRIKYGDDYVKVIESTMG